ncbi:aspartyl asparaginyl beta-hydroxylase [Stylonychia lemnae]|uniref:Aspartyl asparaginyl beta-hydroxylase n=1 Tax=Stylonychia lemnae TaxID=5949 RepID=A0A078ATK2_STYLE|nr:aspartyl asparaginyl beta-hydroxylase [Stylonychia lemnae]|eukprot:CDW84183.1 aspartyl asparaginyl beta-hydroxylase [Stylonychia lemnae]
MSPVLAAKKFWDKKEFDWVDEFVSYQDVFIKENPNSTKIGCILNAYIMEFKFKVQGNIGKEYQGAWNLKYQESRLNVLESMLHILIHIEARNGNENKRLKVILLLIGADGSKMKFSDEWVYHQARNLFIFDDNFVHEVQNEVNTKRLIFIIDIWHPDYSDEEIQFFEVLEKESYKMGLIQRCYDKGINMEEQNRIISQQPTNITESMAEYEQNIFFSDK